MRPAPATRVGLAEPRSDRKGSQRDNALRVLCAVLGMGSVSALLAWGFRLGPFAVWFWAFSAPAMLLLAGIAVVASRRTGAPALRAALVAGAVGGLLGTFGYDAVRVLELPFGLRPYLPIDSYGLLMLNASHSSGLTELAGWGFNVLNGVGFGVTYAMLARGRSWWWAVPYALVLETAFVVTPLSGLYQLSGHWDLIALAYGAHVCYAYPLGKVVQHTDSFVAELDALSRRTTPVALAAVAAVLLAWHHPWTSTAAERSADALGAASVPGAVIVAGRFVPEWLRVAPDGCVVVRDDDLSAYTLRGARGTPAIQPGMVARVCVDGSGIVRVRTSDAPYAGGIVFVDPELSAA